MTELKRTQRDYPLSFKIAVVEQVEKGKITYNQAQQRYGIQGRSTVLVWLRKYGRLDWSPGLPDLVKRKLPVTQTTIPLTTKLSAISLLSGLRTAVFFGSSPNIRANWPVSLAGSMNHYPSATPLETPEARCQSGVPLLLA